jgi:hypothetical protein
MYSGKLVVGLCLEKAVCLSNRLAAAQKSQQVSGVHGCFMKRVRSFRDLDVWKESMVLVEENLQALEGVPA